MSIELDSNRPFAGRYRVLRRIASGGMGAVFEVEHIETQRRRALKVMLPELVTNQELRDRFQMEARVTARIDSEYIVDVFDAGIDQTTGMPFLVMELLQGEELGNLLSRSAVAPEAAITYLRQVASALDKTHAAGIVHRDLKPENLFLTHREDGTPRVKILDFGISKVVNDVRTGANATRSLGTPLYMAPEQVLGQAVSAATDLYSLALIAYTLLVGESYWQRDADNFENTIAFVVHVTKGANESASERAALVGCTLPPGFDDWFRRATHLDPSQRYQRASELVAPAFLVARVGRGDLRRAAPKRRGAVFTRQRGGNFRTHAEPHRPGHASHAVGRSAEGLEEDGGADPRRHTRHRRARCRHGLASAWRPRHRAIALSRQRAQRGARPQRAACSEPAHSCVERARGIRCSGSQCGRAPCRRGEPQRRKARENRCFRAESGAGASLNCARGSSIHARLAQPMARAA